MAVISLTALPQSPGGNYYATNNQFLISGPKGFHEFKLLENDDFFVRMDFPGVPDGGGGVSVRLDKTENSVIIYTQRRQWFTDTTAPTGDISQPPVLTANVVRSQVSLTKCATVFSGLSSLKPPSILAALPASVILISLIPEKLFYSLNVDKRGTGPHGTDPHDPALTGPVLKPLLEQTVIGVVGEHLRLQPHPNVLQGCVMAHEYKPLENDGLYVRLDMPGVPKDGFTASVDEEDGRVKVTGVAPAVDHDFDGRFYSGHVAVLVDHVPRPGRRIKTIVKNGVIRLLIPSV